MNREAAVLTLVHLLQYRAVSQPEGRAYTLLAENATAAIDLTYRQLDREARAIGARLQSLAAAGERVLLLYPTSIEYITAFFGCLYAGAVPVPGYPPRRNRPDARIRAMAADSRATIALTTPAILSELHRHVEHSPELKGLRCLSCSYPEPDGDAQDWAGPAPTGDSLAYIQYTSGSTASPKGVMLSHQNLLHNLAQIQEAFAIGPEGMGVSWLPLYHDMGLIGGILLALYAGKPLALLSPLSFAQHPLRWLQAITHYRGTESGGPSFAYQWCVDRITPEERATLDLGSWKVAFCGAEPIDADVLDRFSQTFAPCGFRAEAFCPSYGLAEATLAVSAKAGSGPPAVYTIQRPALEQGHDGESAGERGTGQRFVSCGQILPRQRVVVVGPESLALCLPGDVGEIWVSGPCVGQGYWNRPEETVKTFRAFLPGTGEGQFLRTGDLGFLKDGELFITGRLKDLIIIHGLNYDPHDIELTAQRSHDALQPGGGAAFSVPVAGEERLVILHELRRTHRKADAAEIARAIRHGVAEEQELPVHAVALVKPGVIPRTSSGKIQRYLCRAEFMAGGLEMIAVSLLEDPLSAEPPGPGSPLVTPRTLLEKVMVQIWAEVLGLEQTGVHDNFFELGGDSLKATQAVSRLREVFQAEMTLRDLFEAPTVAGLAAVMGQKTGSRPALQMPPIEPLGREGPLPLSFAQERMWFLHQLNPDSSAYNIPGALRVTGPLDRNALEQSLHETVRRHEAFRTTFSALDGQPVQVISPLPEPPLQVVDFRRFPGAERDSRAMSFAREEARRPFNLTSGPLLRVSLLQIDDEEHVLLFNMHHIISDAWSLGVLTGEIVKLYNAYASGESAHLPDLHIQYADFAAWQKQWLRDQALETLLAYWRKHLRGVPILELPTDYPRPAVQSYRGAVERVEISRELMAGLGTMSNREGVTSFMTLLAAFLVLLYRYTGQEDVAISVPVANRNWLPIEAVVGSFVNTLVLRTDLSGDPTVAELLLRVREASLGAFTHQDMPYAKLVAELQPERDTSHSPLAQVMFNVINVTMPSLELENLHVTPLEVDRSGAQFDLTMTILDNDLSREISIEYSTDLFAASTMRRMLRHFQTLLEGIVSTPGQRISSLPMLDEAERRQLIVAWNDTRMDYPEATTLARLFEAQVERSPGAPAFVYGRQSLSYEELNRRANQLAYYLQSLGVGPNLTVGVLLERSLKLAVGLLGVLKAGGAYLPLDPSHPQERLAFMLHDARATVLITEESQLGCLPQHEARVVCLDADRASLERQGTSNPISAIDAGSPAYVLYTSGSTGRPKGVLGPHRGAVNRFAWMWQTYPFRNGDVCCQKTPVTFVDSVWELFGPLLQGVSTVILPDSAVRDPQQLVKSLAASRVTRIVLVPSLLKAILDTHNDLQRRLPDLRFWVCSGESLPVELVMRFRMAVPHGTLLNLYGCSEVAADSTCYNTAQLAADSLAVPIGRPIANTQIYLLDGHHNPVPVGVPGEIYVGGTGLAQGYIHNPELTRERFVPDRFGDDPAARLYRTGDLGRYRPDGNIEYLGRRDHQVQIRGFRVELGEIEAVLSQHPAVAQATVLSVQEGPDNTSPVPNREQRLIACLVAAEGTAPFVKELRTWLGTRLPSYMIPSAFLFLETMPLNPHGKLDRHALLGLAAAATRGVGEFAAPRDGIEGQLVRIWEEVLGTKPIGIRDNFFDLGGHSLLAIRLFARIREVLDTELPVASLFQAPTVEQLAEVIRQAGDVPAWSSLVSIQLGGSKTPFFCVHSLDGGVWGYAELARLLGPEQPFYGLQARGLEGSDPFHLTIEDMAGHYVQAMRRAQPDGPYCLGGYSAGGLVAFEMARLLHAQGQQVALLALFDTYAPLAANARRRLWNPLVLISVLRNLPLWVRDFSRRADRRSRLLARARRAAKTAWLPSKRDREALLTEAVALGTIGNAAGISEERRRLVVAQYRALENYRPQTYPGRLTVFRVRGMRLFRADDPGLGWGKLATGDIEVRMIPGAHYNLLEKPDVNGLAGQLRDALARAEGIYPDS